MMNQSGKCRVLMKGIIPHYGGCSILSPRQSSLDNAVHPVNRNS